MLDILDNIIICKKCKKRMELGEIEKNGFRIRFIECRTCKDRIYHPSDLEEYKRFNELKHKPFSVKLRIVGNSYAVSIPKEIIEFIKEQESIHNEVVRLCLEESGKLSLFFTDMKTLINRKVKEEE